MDMMLLAQENSLQTASPKFGMDQFILEKLVSSSFWQFVT
jgi:hypothetical protein